MNTQMEKIKIHKPVASEFEISSPYGERTHPVTGELGKMHYGIDFKTPVGTPVVASITGKIVLAGWQDTGDYLKGFGLRVWQKDNEKDLFVVYGHLSEISVKEGEEVVAGTRIGLSGNTGASSGPHLHHECRIGGIAGVKGSDFSYITDERTV